MVSPLWARFAPNWVTLAGAVEGVLSAIGYALPRHAVMGLTGCAFAFALVEGRNGIPDANSIHAFDSYALQSRLARTGVQFERFAPSEVSASSRRAAIEWMQNRIRHGIPVVAWALRLRAWGIVRAVDEQNQRFVVDDLLTPEVGEDVAWVDWPWEGERIELLAPTGVASDADGRALVGAALDEAVGMLRGTTRPSGLRSGADALVAWAEAFEEGRVIDRSGNAQCLAAVQAARFDGALFLEDVANSIAEAADQLRLAAGALRTEAESFSRLVSLFPYPSGGSGALASSGIRRIAAATLRRAAELERVASSAIATAASLT